MTEPADLVAVQRAFADRRLNRHSRYDHTARVSSCHQIPITRTSLSRRNFMPNQARRVTRLGGSLKW